MLDLDDVVFAVTSADDVETAKPEPDLIEVALQKAGVPADRALMVGDSVWDVQAARRAGVAAVGVLSGNTSREDLLREGAAAVFNDVAEFARHLDDTAIAGLRAAD